MKPSDSRNVEVGRLIRVEKEEKSGKMRLIFEVTDLGFQKKIEENWLRDEEVMMNDDKLIWENDITFK